MEKANEKCLVRINEDLKEALMISAKIRGFYGYELMEMIIKDWLKENEPSILMRVKKHQRKHHNPKK